MPLDSCINCENTNGLTAGTEVIHRSCVCGDPYPKGHDTIKAYGGFGGTALMKYISISLSTQ
jgi:hypothetical protein